MTSIEAAFYAYITAQSTVTSLVGTRVYQDIMPQRATYPAIVYSLIGEERADGYSFGTTVNGQVEARLQVAAWATTSVAAREIYDAVRRLVNGFKGTWGENAIQSVFIDSTESVVDVEPTNEAARVYGYRTDLIVSFVENETDEVQSLAFSRVPAYGYGTFSGPGGESVVVDFAANLATEQAVFDAAMSGKSPTISQATTQSQEFLFATGSYAGTALTQMTFTPNTTTRPLNDGTSGAASLVKTQSGNAVGAIPTQYELTWPAAYGWVEISGNVVSRQAIPAQITASGTAWDLTDNGVTLALVSVIGDDFTLSLVGTYMGNAVTGTMSTPTPGGSH